MDIKHLNNFRYIMSICAADCPTERAPPYPGVWTRKNPTGSLLSKSKYIESMVQQFVDHFGDSETFQNTSLSNKTKYLVLYLDHLKVKNKVAKKILADIESKQSKTSPNIVGEDERMETEREDDEDQTVDTSTPDLLADMFSDGEEQEDGLSRVKIEIEIASILAKSDSELFEEGLNVPERVKRSKKYIDRKRN